MSFFDNIKEKIIGKKKFEDSHHDLKYAVEQKPRVNLDKYNPFPTPEQLMKQKRETPKNNIAKDFEIPDVPKFEPMDMPLNAGKETEPTDRREDDIKFIIEQLESLRSQNEMILHRLKNIERKLNER